MKITKKYLRNIIREELEIYRLESLNEAASAPHRCMDGSMVSSDSAECHSDIVNRIDDAEYNRNSHSCGTENRIYYNGLLKGLRKQRNKLQKHLPILDVKSKNI
jgi:hypothetical protein